MRGKSIELVCRDSIAGGSIAARAWVLAIDFGTSFTVAAARIDEGEPAMMDIDGERRMPSVLLVDGDDIVVGRVADEFRLLARRRRYAPRRAASGTSRPS